MTDDAREIAAKSGQKRYHGAPCRQSGHGTLRYVVNAQCVICASAGSKKKRNRIKELMDNSHKVRESIK